MCEMNKSSTERQHAIVSATDMILPLTEPQAWGTKRKPIVWHSITFKLGFEDVAVERIVYTVQQRDEVLHWTNLK